MKSNAVQTAQGKGTALAGLYIVLTEDMEHKQWNKNKMEEF